MVSYLPTKPKFAHGNLWKSVLGTSNVRYDDIIEALSTTLEFVAPAVVDMPFGVIIAILEAGMILHHGPIRFWAICTVV